MPIPDSGRTTAKRDRRAKQRRGQPPPQPSACCQMATDMARDLWASTSGRHDQIITSAAATRPPAIRCVSGRSHAFQTVEDEVEDEFKLVMGVFPAAVVFDVVEDVGE